MSNALTTTAQGGALAAAPDAANLPQLSAAQIIQRMDDVKTIMANTMISGVHYGTIPGCGSQPTLLKPGAEMLAMTFRIAPEIVDCKTSDLVGEHREYTVTCALRHIGTGVIWAYGIGSCATTESKYRYRTASLKCPNCKKETIRKSKDDGSWYCWNKIGGCGAKFDPNNADIKNQPVGKIENPDIADQYNTCLKMAKKRAQIDATLTALACSHLFTQDLEDYKAEFAEAEVAQEPSKPDYSVNLGGPPNASPAPAEGRKMSGPEKKKFYDFLMGLPQHEMLKALGEFCEPKDWEGLPVPQAKELAAKLSQSCNVYAPVIFDSEEDI